MVAMLEALLDEAAGDENYPAMGLVDIVGDLIEDFEAEPPSEAASCVGAAKPYPPTDYSADEAR